MVTERGIGQVEQAPSVSGRHDIEQASGRVNVRERPQFAVRHRAQDGEEGLSANSVGIGVLDVGQHVELGLEIGNDAADVLNVGYLLVSVELLRLQRVAVLAGCPGLAMGSVQEELDN